MIPINLSGFTANGSSPLYDPSYPTGNRPAGSNFFPAGYFVTAQMPMTVVRPRANTEVIGLLSYDHNAYVGIETRIKVTVQGGAFPFVIENAVLPAGATMGNTYFDNDYMIFRYTPSANGNQSVSFDIVDQDGTRRNVAWTINVNTDWLRFAAPGGNDTTGTGTYAAPWATIEKAFSTVTGGRGLCLKDGTYTLTAAGKSMGSTFVNSIFAEHERGATVDAAGIVAASGGRHFYMNSPSTFIGGIRFINPTTAGANPRWFSDENTACNNTYMDNCYFDIAGRLGTDNGDNISCFFLGGDSSSATRRHNVAQTRCDFNNFIGSSNGWSSIDYYCTEHVVIENNTLDIQVGNGTPSAGVIWVKGAENKYTTIRGNEFKNFWSGTLVDIYMANNNETDLSTGYVELCYNIIRGNDNPANGDGAVVIARASQNGARAPVYMYRNTIIGRVFVAKRDYPVTLSSTSDIIIHNHTNADPWKIYIADGNDGWNQWRPLSWMPSLTANITNYELHLTSATGVLDAAAHLVGTHRTSWIGKRGAEVYNPSQPTGTVFAQGFWENGATLPPMLSVDSVWGSTVLGSSTLVVENGALKGTNIDAQASNDIIVGIGADVLTNHVYAEFDAKFVGTPHAIKFFKIHGKTTSGYANSTYGVDGGGEISRFSFGDGGQTTNDTANILLFDGSIPGNIGARNSGAIVRTPQMAFFPGSLWNNNWHHFRIYHKFNTGTSAGNEVADGEMYLEIDGRVYGHIKNMFNRHWSNDGIEYISIFDVAQGGGSYTLYYDNMYLSTGGWRP